MLREQGREEGELISGGGGGWVDIHYFYNWKYFYLVYRYIDVARSIIRGLINSTLRYYKVMKCNK